ncbi:MAG: two-component regulator propeller domain-containing protein [Bacteroidota bacterium]|nr:two-component regulator propeller domain-containing protein [Bacteroidota bacterium]
MAYKYLLFTAFIFLTIFNVNSQPSIGEWTDYQSYAHAKNVVDTGEKIYCVTEGGLFSYNKSDNSIQKMSGINGLSDAGVERLAYSKENKLLLVAYENANVDLIFDTKIFNLSDIKRKQIPADKKINNVLFVGNLAYLSCGFGIVVINLERKEIKDSYFIGQDGAYVNVLDMTTDGTFLYAATANGIYKALASEPNLQNYNNWSRITNIPNASKKFSKIKYFKGKIFANYTPDEWAQDEMYELTENGWVRFLPRVNYVSDVTISGNYLVFSSREEIFIYDDKLELVKYVYQYSFSGKDEKPISTMCAVLDEKNVLWIADRKYGLIKVGSQTEKIIPDGPIDNKIFSLKMNGNDLWITPGGKSNPWGNLYNQPQFQLNREGKWSVFDRNVFPILNDLRDMVCVVANPKDPDHVFAGSWGGGVLEFRNGKFVKQYNNLNSSLQTQLPGQPNEPYVRVGGMDFDSKGNLWVTNSGVANVISVFQTDGQWKSYELSGIANNTFIGKVLVTKDDDKWVILGRGQYMYALNSANNKSKMQKVTAYFTNAKEELYTDMSDVNAIAEDQNGELWLGTSSGVAVFTNPQKIWEDATMFATRPGLDLNDGKFHPLLEKESITAIAIDGANRKWIGTKTSGIFLISENGDTELEHFNKENSPLPTDEITDIAINQKSGEVFIGTSVGLISYMGEATAGNEEFADVYVYPNPVRETYDGPIVVKGLVEDTDLRITDISGNLVHKTTSLGGQAIWDGRNLNGNRCKTGVYLVFMSDASGNKTMVTKLLFIH